MTEAGGRLLDAATEPPPHGVAPDGHPADATGIASGLGMTRRSLIWLTALATLLVAVHAVIASRFGVDADDLIIDYTWVEVPIYLAAVLVVLFDRGEDAPATRRAVAAILVVGVILRAMLVPGDPVSTDVNRYVWDGRVQAAGINPYRYIPADPALRDLRDDDIYPEINRKDYAPTIYPPLAQIVFFLVTRVSETLVAMKAAMTLFDVATMLILLRLLTLRGRPPTRVLLYAWHPVPVWQFSGDGHVDAVAITCICAALLAVELRRPVLAGIALGGATLVKFFPVAIGPALYRRWDWKLPLAGFLTLVVLYLPYLGAGSHLFGFLSAYGDEEGFRDGSGVFLWIALTHFFPDLPQRAFGLFAPFAALVMSGFALSSLLRRDRDKLDLRGAFLIATAFTFLSSPHYIWYVAWLIPFLCFVTSWSVLWLTVAATFMNVLDWPNLYGGGAVVFFPFLAIALVEVLVDRLRRARVKDVEEAGPLAPTLP